MEQIIEISDLVYTFCEVIDHIDLNKYLVVEEHKTGRPQYDRKILLTVVLFAFMENGYSLLREIEKLCEYTKKLKKYFEHIKICGDDRNSYSKTDHDATFMRMKRDHMGNDQLPPGTTFSSGSVMSTLRFLILNNTLPIWTAFSR